MSLVQLFGVHLRDSKGVPRGWLRGALHACEGGWLDCYHNPKYPGLHVFPWGPDEMQRYSSSIRHKNELVGIRDAIQRRGRPTLHAAIDVALAEFEFEFSGELYAKWRVWKP